MMIPQRHALDTTKNKHGEALTEFLSNAMCCVLNGRVTPQYDNFTSVSTEAKAVVDYILAPHDCLNMCLEYKLLMTRWSSGPEFITMAGEK